jgi:hypothetical protein
MVGVLVTLVPVLTIGGGAREASAATSPSASPSASPSGGSARFAIVLEQLEPKVAHKTDTLTVSGTLTNVSDDLLTNVSVSLRVSNERIGTRYDLARDADPSVQLGSLISATRQRIGAVEPGSKISFHISIPVDQLGLPNDPSMFGAYPLTIEVTSLGNSGTARTRLPTTLIWMPDHAAFTPTKLSWLWPITDGLHRGVGDVFINDDLATDLSPTGRVGRLVAIAAAAHVPVTYVVDPALVDDATAMATSAPALAERGGTTASAKPGTKNNPPANPQTTTPPPTPAVGATTNASANPSGSEAPSGSASASPKPYRVMEGKQTVAGTGAAVAAGWLTALKAAVSHDGAQLVALPYGDADVVALARAGLDQETARARTIGQSVLSSELAAPTLPDVVWPVGGEITTQALGDLAADMVNTVVLNGQVAPPSDPNAVGGPRTNLQTASGTVHGVLSDPTLNHLIADPGSVAGGQRAAEQRFLAETMLITEQRPGSGSSVVITPPRRADPANSFLSTALNDTATAPWLDVVGLDAIAAQPADDVDRQPLTYSDDARRAELSQAALAPISDLRSALATYGSVLGSSTTDSFLETANLAILRAESSGWRTNTAESVRITDTVRAELTERTKQVFINDPRLITLTSRKQKIPITVVNNLPVPVTVQLKVSSLIASRLKVAPIRSFTIEGRGSRHEVLLEVEAPTNGRFQVEAELVTPDTGRPFGNPVFFEVNSTAYGAVALTIAGSAAGLLFLLSGYRLIRRVRRRRHAADSALAP